MSAWYAVKILTLPEGASDYTETLMTLRVRPTIVVSDSAHIVACHTNRHYPDPFRPHNGQIADPDDQDLVEIIKSGKHKENFDMVPLATPFDIGTIQTRLPTR